MDQLWEEPEGKISANFEFSSIDENAEQAENWLLDLSQKEALRKGGVWSKNYWLRSFLR